MSAGTSLGYQLRGLGSEDAITSHISAESAPGFPGDHWSTSTRLAERNAADATRKWGAAHQLFILTLASAPHVCNILVDRVFRGPREFCLVDFYVAPCKTKQGKTESREEGSHMTQWKISDRKKKDINRRFRKTYIILAFLFGMF